MYKHVCSWFLNVLGHPYLKKDTFGKNVYAHLQPPLIHIFQSNFLILNKKIDVSGILDVFILLFIYFL